MAKVNLKKGRGYVTDGLGNITHKFDFPIGDHIFPDGITVTEVNSEAELQAVKLHRPPLSVDSQHEILIRDKVQENTRAQAITDLKGEGKLPPDYVDPKGR